MFFDFLTIWIRGLLSIALLVTGVLLIKEWVDELPTEAHWTDVSSGKEIIHPLDTLSERVAAWEPAPNRSTGLLVAGALLLLFTFAGRWVSPWLWRRGGTSPRSVRSPEMRRLKTRHGYEIHVDVHGSADAPALVLVHGVGSDRTQWRDTIEGLSDRFRIYAFDLLGHGESDHVPEAEHTIDAAARDLDEVIALAGREPVLLAGHSMGGMIAMTWCSTHAAKLSRLAGLVLVHTTPQNPFETMAPVPLHRALLKPVHEPVLRLTPSVAPWVRLMNTLDYLNGTTHWANDRGMFGGSESREQLERSARLHAGMDPAAVARFTLSMARFDIRKKLPLLDVPTLVVGADKDGVTLLEASREIVRQLPSAELLVLDDTRHMGFMERSREFVEAIDRFHDESGRSKAAAAGR